VNKLEQTTLTKIIKCCTQNCTEKNNMLYLINKIVATDYKQYYLLNCTN